VDNAVEAFILALPKKDADGVRAAVTPDVHFRGLTPDDTCEAHSAEEVVGILLGKWFEPQDEIKSLVSYDVHDFVGRFGFIYRIRGRNADGDFIVEQQGYATLADDGRVADISIVCSGYRQES
jgi:hypothetical protein